jgi:hypothetical protein
MPFCSANIEMRFGYVKEFLKEAWGQGVNRVD